jgi:hypothetical protein
MFRVHMEIEGPSVLGAREVGAYYAITLRNTRRFFEHIQANPGFGRNLLDVLTIKDFEQLRQNVLFRYAYRQNDSIKVAEDVGLWGGALGEENARLLQETFSTASEQQSYYLQMIARRQRDMAQAQREISKLTQDLLIRRKIMDQSEAFTILLDQQGFWSEENYLVDLAR